MTHQSILVVLTNTTDMSQGHNREEYGNNPNPEANPNRTGFDIKEVAYVYECLYKQHNVPLIFASPKGGDAHPDPRTMEANQHDHIVQKFMKDHEAMNKIKNTKKLRDVQNQKFHGVIFPGSAGVLFDLPNDNNVMEIVPETWEKQKGFIAAIGHGLAALINVKTEKGDLFLKGKRVTCQSLEEERELKLERVLPYMIEDKLKQIGAKFEKVNKFQPHVVVDERLITAQNNISTKEWVEAIGRHMKEMGN